MLRRSWIVAVVGTLFFLFSQPILLVQSHSAKPEVVKVGIFLILGGSLDITTGAIDVDFYIDFTCENLCDKKQDKFEVVNGTLKSAVLLEDAESGYNPTYRASATVFQEVDLRQYPFDQHPVQIVI